MSTSDQLVAPRSFFEDTLTMAITYRLSFAQREANNHRALALEFPNIWEAVRQSYMCQSWDNVAAFRDALQAFTDLRGYWQESLTLNQWACEAARALGDDRNVARWTHDQADILHQSGRYAEAEDRYRASETAYRALGEHTMALKSRHMRSLVARAQGRMRVAKHLCTTVITEARHLGLEPWLAHPLYVQGLLARDNGDFRQAQRAIEESLVRLSHTNDLALIAQCQHFLGELSLLRGDMSGAHFHLEQSLRLSQQASIIRRVAATQRLLADLARLEGRYEDAQQLCYTALEVVSRLGDRPLYARLLLSQAQLAVRLGQMQTAVELLRGAQATYADIEDARGVVWTSLLLARAYLSQGRWSNALQNIVVAMKKAPAAGLMHPRGIIGMLRRWTSE